MYAIARPWEPRPGGLFAGTPVPLLAGLAALLTGAAGLGGLGVLPPRLTWSLAAGCAQGALLATAVAWAGPRRSPGRAAPSLAAAMVLAGALCTGASPAGAVVYLAAPAWLWSRRMHVPGLGLRHAPPGLVVAGAGLGALLGAHLLLTASLTLGYGVRVPQLAALGPWLAYDAGANVLATEAFFRGALFDRAQRRWPFALATALATAACLARYLADPLLPRTLEVTAGAVFYLTLLSVANCWLYWRSGSIVPGLAAGLVFFTTYRLLAGAG
jgi:hypothetical protein